MPYLQSDMNWATTQLAKLLVDKNRPVFHLDSLIDYWKAVHARDSGEYARFVMNAFINHIDDSHYRKQAHIMLLKKAMKLGKKHNKNLYVHAQQALEKYALPGALSFADEQPGDGALSIAKDDKGRLSLKEIIRKAILPLFEGRVEDAKAKAPDEVRPYIDWISERDPSGNNKYLGWIVKQLIKTYERVGGSQDLYPSALYFIEIIQDFHKFLPYIENKDINFYNNAIHLKSITDKAKKEGRLNDKQKIKEGRKRIYEDDHILILQILNYEASCKYGRQTKWCISAIETEKEWKRYTQRPRKGPFKDEPLTPYFIILKGTNRKFALMPRRDPVSKGNQEIISIWDEHDASWNAGKFRLMLIDYDVPKESRDFIFNYFVFS